MWKNQIGLQPQPPPRLYVESARSMPLEDILWEGNAPR